MLSVQRNIQRFVPVTRSGQLFARLLAHRDGWELYPDPWSDVLGDEVLWSAYGTQREQAIELHERALLESATVGDAVLLLPGLLRLRMLPAYLGPLRDDPVIDAALAVLCIRAWEQRWIDPDELRSWCGVWRDYRTTPSAAIARMLLLVPEGEQLLQLYFRGESARWDDPIGADALTVLASRVGRIDEWAERLLDRGEGMGPAGMRAVFDRWEQYPESFRQRFLAWILDSFWWWIAGDSLTNPLLRTPTWKQATRLVMMAYDRLPEEQRGEALRQIVRTLRSCPDDRFARYLEEFGVPERAIRDQLAYWDRAAVGKLPVLSSWFSVDEEAVVSLFARAERVPTSESAFLRWYDRNVMAPNAEQALRVFRALAGAMGEPPNELLVRVVSFCGAFSRAQWARRIAEDEQMKASLDEQTRGVLRAWSVSARSFEEEALAAQTNALGTTALLGVASMCLLFAERSLGPTFF